MIEKKTQPRKISTKMFYCVLALAIQALAAWVIYVMNFQALQRRKDGAPDGKPNLGLVLVISFVIGFIALYFMVPEGKRGSLLGGY